MSATKKITKDMIVDAALEIFRAEGFDAVTSRRVAFKLGCSTQPIYFEYKNMDELKNDIVKKVVGQLNEIFSSGYKKISEDEMQKNLGILFASICSVYGPPPKLMKIEKFRNHFEKLMTSLKK